MARKPSDEDIIATCRERLKIAQTAEAEIRREALIDLQFAAGQQWDTEDERRRNAVGGGAGKRPCLTFNKLTGPLNMVANEARMNKPGLQALPVDSSGDADTAAVIEGMIRHIEYISKAEQVYETAIEQSTKGAIGAFKITTKYVGNKSFNQELRIERITNPFSVYMDPWAQEADKSDATWAVELEWLSRDEYEQEFGQTEISKLNYYDGGTNPAPEWIGKDGVLIARYWYVEVETKKLIGVQWPDGKVTAEYYDDLPDDLPEGIQFAKDADGNVLEREDEIRHVRMCRINGVEILDKTEWKGQYIPILLVLGEEMYIENKRYVFSLIRFARDPQKLYNFYRSSEAETVMLGTKAPWVGAKGMFKDPRWATANTTPWAYLEYEPLDIAGNPASPPQRNLFEPPIQALSFGAAQASDDIKATTNIYDASLGQMSNETSGVAIRQRQSQGGLSNFHFIDNLNRAILQAGKILVDLIPKVYDTPREIRILGEDMKEKIVKVNQQYIDENGYPRNYDLTNANYDVRIKVGPNWKTDQEKASEMLTQLAQAYPPLMQVAGDLIFDNLNFKGSDKIAERLRRTLPPALQEKPDVKPAELLAQQNQQMGMQIDQMTQQMQALQQDIATKRVEIESKEKIEQAKIESSDRQAALKAQVDLLTSEAKLGSNEAIIGLREELAMLKLQIERMATGAAAEASGEESAGGEGPAVGLQQPPAMPIEQQTGAEPQF